MNDDIANEAKLQLKPDQFIVGTALVGRLEMYWILYSDLDMGGRNKPTDDAILSEAIKGLTQDAKGKVVRQTPKRVDGFPASEVVVHLDEGETHHYLIVIAKSRVYVAAVGGPFVSVGGNHRIRKFFDSFHVVKDNPWRGPKPADE